MPLLSDPPSPWRAPPFKGPAASRSGQGTLLTSRPPLDVDLAHAKVLCETWAHAERRAQALGHRWSPEETASWWHHFQHLSLEGQALFCRTVAQQVPLTEQAVWAEPERPAFHHWQRWAKALLDPATLALPSPEALGRALAWLDGWIDHHPSLTHEAFGVRQHYGAAFVRWLDLAFAQGASPTSDHEQSLALLEARRPLRHLRHLPWSEWIHAEGADWETFAAKVGRVWPYGDAGWFVETPSPEPFRPMTLLGRQNTPDGVDGAAVRAEILTVWPDRGADWDALWAQGLAQAYPLPSVAPSVRSARL